MAGVAFIFWMALGLAFARSTEALTRRAKRLCFESIISRDAEFFDDKEHSIGMLASLLTTSTEHLSNLSGPVIGSILTFLSTIGAGIIISMVLGWKLALVCTATIPVVVACGWIRLRMLASFDGKIKQSGKDAAAYASEMVSSIRTVASLSLEEQAVRHYDKLISSQAAKSLPSILSASALYAASQSVIFFAPLWHSGMAATWSQLGSIPSSNSTYASCLSYLALKPPAPFSRTLLMRARQCMRARILGIC